MQRHNPKIKFHILFPLNSNHSDSLLGMILLSSYTSISLPPDIQYLPSNFWARLLADPHSRSVFPWRATVYSYVSFIMDSSFSLVSSWLIMQVHPGNLFPCLSGISSSFFPYYSHYKLPTAHIEISSLPFNSTCTTLYTLPGFLILATFNVGNS